MLHWSTRSNTETLTGQGGNNSKSTVNKERDKIKTEMFYSRKNKRSDISDSGKR